ncbi:MAG: non-hydrolyzing UDP-N-acetylglucosamine 2-epimerase [Bacillota bacterium]
MSVIGTRPEAIKMAPMLQRLKRSKQLESILVATAQHRKLLDEVLNLFNLAPDYDLDIMSSRQSLTKITIKILDKLKEIISQEQPDLVLVHGDTTTTFATALAAFYQKCALAHIEAGLRSYNKYEPYPEELNRKLTSGVADLHFAPTQESYNNLLAENISADKVFITGNTVIDAALSVVDKNYKFRNAELKQLPLKEYKIILTTVHRRENLGQPLVSICRALRELVVSNPELVIVIPVHPNPKVQKVIYAHLDSVERIFLVEPLNYRDFINLMARSYLVLTDSGGLQEEAPALGKPVLVLRSTTERQAGLKAGTLQLVGTKSEQIVNEVQKLLSSQQAYQQMIKQNNPYGDGQASQRIVDYLQYYFNLVAVEPEQFE